MANLKVRLQKVIKASTDLLFYLPPEYFNLSSKRKKIVSHADFPTPEEVSQVKNLLFFDDDTLKFSITKWSCFRNAVILSDFILASKFMVDPKVNLSAKKLKESIEEYTKAERRAENVASQPRPPLNERTTKELKKLVRSFEGDTVTSILKDREHVMGAAQSKLLRKMRIHSGKKLTLREAQLLSNSLNKKKQK